MLRFKQFSGSGAELESTINRWLEDFEPEVSQMVQTTDAGGNVTIGILFEESFRGQEMRLTAESTARASLGSEVRPADLRDEPLKVRADGN